MSRRPRLELIAKHTNLDPNVLVDGEQTMRPPLIHINEEPLRKLKGTFDEHRNLTLYQSLQERQPLNINTKIIEKQIPKSDILCPLLSRRGWCLKKDKCNFKHPRRLHLNEPLSIAFKHGIRCPFLFQRGYCLKDNHCDFLHSDTLSFPSTKRSDVFSHTHYNPFFISQAEDSEPKSAEFAPNRNIHVSPIYPAAPWSTLPQLKSLMGYSNIPTLVNNM